MILIIQLEVTHRSRYWQIYWRYTSYTIATNIESKRLAMSKGRVPASIYFSLGQVRAVYGIHT